MTKASGIELRFISPHGEALHILTGAGQFGARYSDPALRWVDSGGHRIKMSPSLCRVALLGRMWLKRRVMGASLRRGPTSRTLSWANGSAEFALGVMGEAHAFDFSTVIGMSLNDIAQRYETP